MTKLLSFLLLFLLPVALRAQESGDLMATQMRNSGKIYVVVAVITVVFLGIAIYLFTIDNRLKKIERKK